MKTRTQQVYNSRAATNPTNKAGLALLAVLCFMAIVMIICGSMLAVTQSHMQSMRGIWESDRALLAAQSALEDAKLNIDSIFRAFYNSPYLGGTQFRWARLDWFTSTNSGQMGRDGYYYVYPQGDSYGENGCANIWINITQTKYVDLSNRDLELTVRAKIGDSERTVTEVVRYGLAKSKVFDYAYFINNFGWFYGTPIYANGDVRANANFSLQSGPTVNGDLYAAINTELAAPGNVVGSWTHQTLSQYYSTAPLRGRPGSPPSCTYDGTWAMGYDGASDSFSQEDQLEMPYLGSLLEYEYLAQYDNGTISQGGVVLVTNVYAGNGPDNKKGTADDKTIILSGTKTNPIVLNGPVVIEGDVIIKGFVSGQGTIYAGRNVHIADDLYYLNPPKWSKPNSDPESAAVVNQGKDFLGLAAKGNVIIGNYTTTEWKNNTSSYQQPSFTKAYTTDSTDASIGYDSDKNPANGYLFNGNYTSLDGGAKLDAAGNSVTNRRYYEASVATNTFNTFCGGSGSYVSNIDAVVYNNHLVSGYTPQGLTVNGALVSRDEAIIFQGSVRFNWDIRLGSESAEAIPTDFYLPRTLAVPYARSWKEGT